MKLQLTLYPITLKLKETFTISRGSYHERKGLVVALANNGEVGYGEASEHQYYGVDQGQLIQKAEAVRMVLEASDFVDPFQLWDLLDPHLKDDPFLQCAFDCAAHDLYGKLKRKPCHELWLLDVNHSIPSSYTISIDTIEKMVEKAKKYNFDLFKIKLGTDHDLEIVKAIRSVTEARLTVDANCAWTSDQTIAYAPKLKGLGVEFIEQPLPAGDWRGMKSVFEQSVLPIFADESCVSEDDVSQCSGYFHGLTLKLMKCGGITPALRMIREGRSLGMKIMMGCMVESSVGISAIAQLLPLLDYVDMDGALLIGNDPAKGAIVQETGQVLLPKENGLGIKWLGDPLEKLSE